MGAAFRHRYAIGATAMIVVAIAVRLPFLADYLWAWDSVLYARAMDSFDVSAGRPHPPGYLFYVAAADLASAFGDTNSGLVLVSTVAGAAVCGAGLLIGRWAFGPAVGILASAILFASPLLWHYSEVAYPYTLLALLSGGVGALLWWSREGRPARVVVASLALGLAAGFRQDLLLLLLPLWVWAVAGRRPAAIAAALGALTIGCFVWLVPTVMLSGGPERYLAVTMSQAVGISPATSGSRDLQQNVLMTAIGLRWQLHWLLPLALVGGVALLWRSRLRPHAWPLALWAVPALLTYALFHIGEWAYTLSLAVPLALVAALGAVTALELARARATRMAAVIAIAAALVLNAQSFVLGAGRFSVAAIEGHGAGLELRFATLREQFPPAETVIVSSGGYQHARYYLPEYRSMYVDEVVWSGRRLLSIGPEVRRAVLFLGMRADPRTPVRTMRGRGGIEIRYVALAPRARVVIQDAMLSVEIE